MTSKKKSATSCISIQPEPPENDSNSNLMGRANSLLNQMNIIARSKLLNEAQKTIGLQQDRAVEIFLKSIQNATVYPYNAQTLVFSVKTLNTFPPQNISNAVSEIINDTIKLLLNVGIGCNLHTILDPYNNAVEIKILIKPLPTCLQKITYDWYEDITNANVKEDCKAMPVKDLLELITV